MESKAAQVLEGMDGRPKEVMKKDLSNNGGGWRKKESVHSVAENFGMKCEWGRTDRRCRLCRNQCTQCDWHKSEKGVLKGKGRKGQEGCAQCDESLEHIVRGQCTSRMEEVVQNAIVVLEREIGKVIKPWDWDMLRWSVGRGIQEATEGEVVVETVWEPKVVKGGQVV